MKKQNSNSWKKIVLGLITFASALTGCSKKDGNVPTPPSQTGIRTVEVKSDGYPLGTDTIHNLVKIFNAEEVDIVIADSTQWSTVTGVNFEIIVANLQKAINSYSNVTGYGPFVVHPATSEEQMDKLKKLGFKARRVGEDNNNKSNNVARRTGGGDIPQSKFRRQQKKLAREWYGKKEKARAA